MLKNQVFATPGTYTVYNNLFTSLDILNGTTKLHNNQPLSTVGYMYVNSSMVQELLSVCCYGVPAP